MTSFIYFCRTKAGRQFSFTSEAYLDTGLIVKDKNGEDGIVEDLAMETEWVSAMDLHVDYELMRALSM